MLRTVASSSKYVGALAVAASIALCPAAANAACSEDAVCSGGPARIMLVLDASSELLNDGNAAAAEGQGDWDLFRTVVGLGPDALFNAAVEPSGPVASQVAHFGLIVFGSDAPAPGEHKRVIDYGPCTQPSIEWALDPTSSCAAPGCTDPYAGPAISWTFVDGSQADPPGFDVETISHMPRCDGPGNRCSGSERYADLGIALANTNRASHSSTTPYVHDATTRYANILLVSDSVTSDQAALQSALEAAFDDGAITYVIGFGAAADPPSAAFVADLEAMAGWGSGGTVDHWEAGNQGQLVDALREAVATVDLPCCQTIDCSSVGGADGGGGDGGDWGGVDGGAADGGTVGADSDGTVGTMTDGADGTDAGQSDELDDDGGCTCRAHRSGPQSWALVFVFLAGLRRRRRERWRRVRS